MSWIQPWNILPLIWKLFRKCRDFYLTRLKVCQVLVGPFYKGWWAKYFCRQSWETGTQNDAWEIYKEFFSYQGRDLIQDSNSFFQASPLPRWEKSWRWHCEGWSAWWCGWELLRVQWEWYGGNDMLWHAADEYIKYYLHQFDLNIDILTKIFTVFRLRNIFQTFLMTTVCVF